MKDYAEKIIVMKSEKQVIRILIKGGTTTK